MAKIVIGNSIICSFTLLCIRDMLLEVLLCSVQNSLSPLSKMINANIFLPSYSTFRNLSNTYSKLNMYKVFYSLQYLKDGKQPTSPQFGSG